MSETFLAMLATIIAVWMIALALWIGVDAAMRWALRKYGKRR